MPDAAKTRSLIEAVIYDMDGVIIDSEPLWRDVEVKVFNEAGIPLTHDMCRETMGLRVDEVVSYWLSRFPSTLSAADMQKGIDEGIIAAIREKGEAMAGVRESLEFFKSKGVKLALASNSLSVLISAVLEKLGLGEYFSELHSGQFEEYGKPHPGIYLTTAKKLEVPPYACLAIEDSINGMISAKAARMKVIAVPDSHLASDKRLGIADVILPSLAAIDERVWEKLAA